MALITFATAEESHANGAGSGVTFKDCGSDSKSYYGKQIAGYQATAPNHDVDFDISLFESMVKKCNCPLADFNVTKNDLQEIKHKSWVKVYSQLQEEVHANASYKDVTDEYSPQIKSLFRCYSKRTLKEMDLWMK